MFVLFCYLSDFFKRSVSLPLSEDSLSGRGWGEGFTFEVLPTAMPARHLQANRCCKEQTTEKINGSIYQRVRSG